MKDFHARRPVNLTARTVIDGPSEHYTPTLPDANRINSDLPLPTKGLPYGIQDLTGIKFGWFTVIGYHDRRAKTGTLYTKWVVRCVCGRYSIRTGKAILAQKNPGESCDRCERIQKLRRGYEKK